MPAKGYQFAATLDELRAKGRVVVHGRHLPVLVIHDRGRVFALDNRCPHMGFPLDRGTAEDGILTCHWHHARFDLASGCAFDLWADDVATCPVEIRGREVWVKPVLEAGDGARHWRGRLEDGMSHNLGLVIAKSVHGLLAEDAAPADILRQAALFGVTNRDGWSSGLTILTALGTLVPRLAEDDQYVALFHGARRVARDCAGEAPRRQRAALESEPDLSTLKRWLRHWCEVRHREGAERTVLTAIASGAPPPALADLLFSAETDRTFAGGGHSLDFINKAFECLDLIGWEHAAAVLPSVVGEMVSARNAGESTAWRQPLDLVALLDETFANLPVLFDGRPARAWGDHAALGEALLAEQPGAVIGALTDAIGEGAEPEDLGRALAYAAALRLARFGTANEQSDWETAHHAFTYCNAVHQGLKRIAGGGANQAGYTDAVRGVFHGAMAVYLARYLNVPPARLPGEEGEDLGDLPGDGEGILAALTETFDRPRQTDPAARLVARYLEQGHAADTLIATLGRLVLREDSGFHAYQVLEAGARQYGEWGENDQGRHILIGVVRYLAAHSPTQRSIAQTADIARRLMLGGRLHEEASAGAHDP